MCDLPRCEGEYKCRRRGDDANVWKEEEDEDEGEDGDGDGDGDGDEEGEEGMESKETSIMVVYVSVLERIGDKKMQVRGLKQCVWWGEYYLSSWRCSRSSQSRVQELQIGKGCAVWWLQVVAQSSFSSRRFCAMGSFPNCQSKRHVSVQRVAFQCIVSMISAISSL